MSKHINKDDSEEDVFAATLYAEARGEKDEGMLAVGHVIMNRADLNRSYFGGSSRKDVCLQPKQFECWNSGDIDVDDMESWNRAKRITQQCFSNRGADPTDGADHYNNPDKEDADWVNRVRKIKRIGNHVFYKS